MQIAPATDHPQRTDLLGCESASSIGSPSLGEVTPHVETGTERVAEWAEIDAAFEELAAATEALNRASQRVNRALGGNRQPEPEPKLKDKSHMIANKLSPEVADVIRRATVTDNSVVLPPDRLAPKLYQAVNKALMNAGGKWNTKSQAHIFSGDPAPKIAAMLETGVAENEKKKYQAFHTPPALALEIAEMADVLGAKVLEPSAGHGALADACRSAGAADVSCVELHSEAAAKLRAKRYQVVEGDFLTLKAEPSFDRVVMNPPFTRDQDIAHVRAALMWLRPGGMLVSVMAGNKERPRLATLLRGLDHDLEDLPSGAFKQSGTSVATMLLTVRLGGGGGVSVGRQTPPTEAKWNDGSSATRETKL